MTVKLTRSYQICSDGCSNWTLEWNKPGRKRPKILGYHGTLELALAAAVEHRLIRRPGTVMFTQLKKLIAETSVRLLSNAKPLRSKATVPNAVLQR